MRPYITDDEIARRLELIENGLAHLEEAIPSIRRKAGELRQLLEPTQQRAQPAAETA